MNDTPLVSIIIPAFNAQLFIAETLKSILDQTYQNFEVIVVDDGSTDNTAKEVMHYDSKVSYYYQINSGAGAVPRNTGIKKCRGELLCFIDADDLMVEDRLETQVDFFKRNPEVSLIFSDYRNFSERGAYTESHFQTCPCLSRYLKGKNEIIIEHACTHLARENFGICSSFMIRRGLLDVEEGFDPALKASEDFHFYYRMARHTKVGVINKIGVMRRLHEHNLSNQTVRILKEGINSRTLLKESEKNPEAWSLLNEYIATCWSDLSRYNANNGRYSEALRNEIHAFSTDFCFARMKKSLRSMARTMALYTGFHKSHEV